MRGREKDQKRRGARLSHYRLQQMDSHINKFIKKHHVLTLATAFDNEPWTANCFYAWMEEENAFIFTSDSNTRHISDLSQGDRVAGSVVLETKVVGRIRGIQFTGRLFEPWGELLQRSKKAYLKRFPYAALMKTQLWVLEVNYVKMTDNRLGFGKKLEWGKTEQEAAQKP